MGLKKVAKFSKEVRSEMSKVTWPNRQETIASTIMVLVIAVIASLFFFLVDQFFTWVIKFVFNF